MAKIPYCAQLPRIIFWGLGILTPLTYIVSAAKGLVASNFNWKGFPLPSTVVSQPPTRYYFGWTSILVIAFMVMLAWRIYKFYKPKKFAKKETKNTILVISSCFALLVTAFMYLGMSFWSMSESPIWHVMFHAAFFACIIIFVTLMDFVINATKEKLEKWTIVYDVIMSVFIVTYIVIGYLILFRGIRAITLSNLALIGYVVVLMTFGRFPILGYQIYGQTFLRKELKKH